MNKQKFCCHCGYPIITGAKFCFKCGNPLLNPDSPTVNIAPHTEADIPLNIEQHPSQSSIHDDYLKEASISPNDVRYIEPKEKWSKFPESGLFKQFSSKDGRLNRLRYFKRAFSVEILHSVLCTFLIYLASFFLHSGHHLSYLSAVVIPLVILKPTVFRPLYALDIRRLKDLNYSLSLAKIRILAKVLNSSITIIYAAFFQRPDFALMRKHSLYALFNTLDYVNCFLWLFLLSSFLFLALKRGSTGSNPYGPDPTNS